jgi:excisionase family DNA binding protein
MDQQVLTLEEVAEWLRVHPSTVYRLLRKRQIPGFRMGSDWRFTQASIASWIEQREAAAGPGAGGALMH